MKLKKLTPPNNEDEIKKSWVFIDKTYISVICICYNQESYIRNAIDSFLSQKTEYRFEIIIHDDASTDKTSTILLEYKNKYPSIIKFISQVENQYLQNKNKPLINCFNISVGEYLAICEGDDYWSSENKLQKQIYCLESNKNINLCFHDVIYDEHGSYIESNCFKSKFERRLTVNEIINATGEFISTPSIFFRRKCLALLPEWFVSAPVGDYFIQVVAGMSDAIYLPEKMAVYRVNSIGSWSEKNNIFSEERIKDIDNRLLYIDLLSCHIPSKKLLIKQQKYRYLNIKSNVFLKNGLRFKALIVLIKALYYRYVYELF